MSTEILASPVRRAVSLVLCTSLGFGTLTLDGCHQPAPVAAPTAPIPASAVAPLAQPQVASAPALNTSTAYELPSASALYEMVAPIALFPDKLLAQVLAGSAYPDQIAAADVWLAQNPTLKPHELESEVDTQAWDPSVKALTQFRSVLDQMAQNIPWTTALGLAYANDPTDVMNAIQVMRQRAQADGALKSDTRQRISTVSDHSAAVDAPPSIEAGQPGSVIVPPPQTILIEPAQPGVVYVPVYNPTVVYGMAVPLYPGYVYAPPAYSEADMVATGLISFGVGVAVGAALENHYNWGWSAWGVHWNSGYAGGWVAHGGVVFHGNPWTSHTTIINHVNNIHVGPNYRPDFGHTIDRHIIDTAPVHRGGPFTPERHEPYRDGTHVADRPLTRPDFSGTMRGHDTPLAQQAHPDLDARRNTSFAPAATQTRQVGAARTQWQQNHPAVNHTPPLAQGTPLRDTARTAPFAERDLSSGALSHFGGLRRR